MAFEFTRNEQREIRYIIDAKHIADYSSSYLCSLSFFFIKKFIHHHRRLIYYIITQMVHIRLPILYLANIQKPSNYNNSCCIWQSLTACTKGFCLVFVLSAFETHGSIRLLQRLPHTRWTSMLNNFYISSPYQTTFSSLILHSCRSSSVKAS